MRATKGGQIFIQKCNVSTRKVYKREKEIKLDMNHEHDIIWAYSDPVFDKLTSSKFSSVEKRCNDDTIKIRLSKKQFDILRFENVMHTPEYLLFILKENDNKKDKFPNIFKQTIQYFAFKINKKSEENKKNIVELATNQRYDSKQKEKLSQNKI